MKKHAPALAASLLLAACTGTPPAKPVAPEPAPATQPEPVTSKPDAIVAKSDGDVVGIVDVPNRPLWRAAPVQFPAGTPMSARIVQIAQREHAAWYKPFIDINGRLASRRVGEAERSRLEGGVEAWERVVAYWRDSGTISRLSGRESADQCQYSTSSAFARNECRSFVVDVPWSAAFISYVMAQAGVPDFSYSASHVDYMRAAWNGRGPYTFHDPNQTPVALGDMLCYIRNNRTVVGFGGLSSFFANGGRSLQSHCDIAVNVTGNEVWLVGGNVANMVTLRKLRLDGQGRAILPRPVSTEIIDVGEEGQSPACSPDNEAACSMNRQNWAALLKLKP